MKKPVFAPWPSFDREIIKAVDGVLFSGKVNQWTGPNVYAFEKEYEELKFKYFTIGVMVHKYTATAHFKFYV